MGNNSKRKIESIPYTLIRRKNQKHVNIRVHHTGDVSVSAPILMSSDRIEKAVQAKKAWIKRHVKRIQDSIGGIDELKELSLYGSTHRIKVQIDPQHRGRIEIDDSNRVIHLRCPYAETHAQKKYLATCLKRHCRKVVVPQVRALSSTLGIEINNIYLRDQRTRWGSSSGRGNISLNWRVVLLPEQTRRYLILHELIHQEHMNHSKSYWFSLGKRFPAYKQEDKILKSYSYLLGLFR